MYELVNSVSLDDSDTANKAINEWLESNKHLPFLPTDLNAILVHAFDRALTEAVTEDRTDTYDKLMATFKGLTHGGGSVATTAAGGQMLHNVGVAKLRKEREKGSEDNHRIKHREYLTALTKHASTLPPETVLQEGDLPPELVQAAIDAQIPLNAAVDYFRSRAKSHEAAGMARFSDDQRIEAFAASRAAYRRGDVNWFQQALDDKERGLLTASQFIELEAMHASGDPTLESLSGYQSPRGEFIQVIRDLVQHTRTPGTPGLSNPVAILDDEFTLHYSNQLRERVFSRIEASGQSLQAYLSKPQEFDLLIRDTMKGLITDAKEDAAARLKYAIEGPPPEEEAPTYANVDTTRITYREGPGSVNDLSDVSSLRVNTGGVPFTPDVTLDGIMLERKVALPREIARLNKDVDTYNKEERDAEKNWVSGIGRTPFSAEKKAHREKLIQRIEFLNKELSTATTFRSRGGQAGYIKSLRADASSPNPAIRRKAEESLDSLLSTFTSPEMAKQLFAPTSPHTHSRKQSWRITDYASSVFKSESQFQAAVQQYEQDRSGDFAKLAQEHSVSPLEVPAFVTAQLRAMRATQPQPKDPSIE